MTAHIHDKTDSMDIAQHTRAQHWIGGHGQSSPVRPSRMVQDFDNGMLARVHEPERRSLLLPIVIAGCGVTMTVAGLYLVYVIAALISTL